MISVELRRKEAGRQIETVGRLTVNDDGTYQMEDPESLFPTPLHVLVPTGTGDLQKVHFEEDPATWARNLGNLMRTGYLMPVITHDDARHSKQEAN